MAEKQTTSTKATGKDKADPIAKAKSAEAERAAAEKERLGKLDAETRMQVDDEETKKQRAKDTEERKATMTRTEVEVDPTDPEPSADPVDGPESEQKTKASAKNKATMSRSKFVNQARGGVGKKDVSYEQRRPINELSSDKLVPIATDAAGYLIASAKWAGLDDPSGNEYSGEGTTGDLLKLEQIPASEAEPGDLVVFGGGTGHSAAVLTEQKAGVWKAVGHGEDGVVEQPLAEMAAAWPEPVTYLRLPV
jgi:hypothetical protein